MPRSEKAPVMPSAGMVTSPPAMLHESQGLAMLRMVVATARTLVHADAVAILLYEREQDLFVPTIPRVAEGLDDRWHHSQGLAAAQALARRAVEAHAVLNLTNMATAADLEFPLLAGGLRPGAACAAPLEVNGELVGALELYYGAPQAAPVDEELLRAFAAMATTAITAAWEHERERSLRLRLEVLDAATQAVAADLALDGVLRRIVEAATTVVGARYGALGVLGEDGYLSDFITVGLTAEERARLGPLPRGHGLLDALIREGAPLRVPDIGRDPRRVGFPSYHPPMTSLLGVPIRVHEQVVGDLYLTDKVGAAAFSEEDQRLVELLAAHAGIAIENAQLHARVGELTQQRERDRIARDLHDGIIQDLYAASLQLEDAAEDQPDAARQAQLMRIVERIDGVIGDIRGYIQGLQARELAGRTLSEGIAALVATVGGRGGLAANWRVEGAEYALPGANATALLQVTREALSNVVKHAHAATAKVRLRYEPTGVTLTIADDGRGFETEKQRDWLPGSESGEPPRARGLFFFVASFGLAKFFHYRIQHLLAGTGHRIGQSG